MVVEAENAKDLAEGRQPHRAGLELVAFSGRFMGWRVHGDKLAFGDLLEDGTRVQLVLQAEYLKDPASMPHLLDQIQRGDWVQVVGQARRTKRAPKAQPDDHVQQDQSCGELSLEVWEMTRMAPCLHNLPSAR